MLYQVQLLAVQQVFVLVLLRTSHLQVQQAQQLSSLLMVVEINLLS